MTPHDADRIDDAALSRDLAALLSPEPSAEFQARLRSLVAREAMAPAGFGLGRSWVLRGAMIAAVGVVLLMLFLRVNQRPRPIEEARLSPSVQQSTVAVPPRPAAADGAGPAAPVARAHPSSRTRAPAASTGDEPDPPLTAPRDPFSDVQVSANELRALRQIATLMAGKQVKEEETPQVAAVRDDMTELVIAPISIVPIQLASIKGDGE